MSTKPAKSRMLILKLAPQHLAHFPPSTDPSSKTSDSRSKSPSSSDTPVAPPAEPSPSDLPSELPSDSAAATPQLNGMSTPSGSLAPPASGGKRKGIPGPRPGAKRGAQHLATDALPKPRGKPGPKKKQKLGDLINDPLAKGPFAAPAPIQRLGPKANQGAINAGLRALDRTGKPCRKWEKKGFQIRSFTGVAWSVPSWRAPKKASAFSEDVKSDSTNSSDTKMKDESSAVSEKSNTAADASTPAPATNGLASSPAPVAAT
ncbi:hypothetical protein EJ04DRAFT_513726 [Polyplosphaeria fusca]|uniref:Uncharacterized protein n=1 Tax=Polyplosphaeria fusca TaxID=682080 RepID=A0A9P4QWQ4_9PLEO|nr:hypothetical protein EJ04DRAFT_513726 [Polyplosphaeria fusca]